jgi:hypothetical protein
MRGYLPVTVSEVESFLKDGTLDVDQLYAPTIKFITANSDLNEEEREYTLSLLAAEEAIEIQEGSFAFIFALEIPHDQISNEDEVLITLKEKAQWNQVECLFLVTDDGEDLTWFATQEIAENLDKWRG